MENENNFQIAKVQFRVMLRICLIFCHFKPGVAYKKTCIYLSTTYEYIYVETSAVSLFESSSAQLKSNIYIYIYIYIYKYILYIIYKYILYIIYKYNRNVEKHSSVRREVSCYYAIISYYYYTKV